MRKFSHVRSAFPSHATLRQSSRSSSSDYSVCTLTSTIRTSSMLCCSARRHILTLASSTSSTSLTSFLWLKPRSWPRYMSSSNSSRSDELRQSALPRLHPAPFPGRPRLEEPQQPLLARTHHRDNTLSAFTDKQLYTSLRLSLPPNRSLLIANCH